MKVSYKQGRPEDVAAHIASELKGSIFILYCADDKHFVESTAKLHELLPETEMIGTTGFMIHQHGSSAEGISALGFMENEVAV